MAGVTLWTDGEGGPENRVGEQVPTSVRGRPALRDGAGAEGPYLIWRSTDGRWVEVACASRRQNAEVAGLDRPEPWRNVDHSTSVEPS